MAYPNMKKRKRSVKIYCPVEYSLEFIRGKWIPSILWSLSESKVPLRFSEIQKANPRIHERVLSRTLRELERSELVTRVVVPKNSLHVEYSLTDLGLSFRPSLQALCKWATENGYEEAKV
jgi:DNA-binding HxlR family transcriptional regulator